MAEQIAILYQSGSIPGIPGVFPGGCSVRYDDHTREVLEVKPLGYEEPATESPVETPETPQEEPAPVEEPPAPTQTFVNGG